MLFKQRGTKTFNNSCNTNHTRIQKEREHLELKTPSESSTTRCRLRHDVVMIEVLNTAQYSFTKTTEYFDEEEP